MKFISKNKYILFVCSCLILVFILFISFSSSLLFVHPHVIQERVKGTVTATKLISKQADKFQTFIQQQLTVLVKEKNKSYTINTVYESDGRSRFPLHSGDQILLTKNIIDGKTEFLYAERYRLNRLFYIIIGFFILVLLLTGKRGFGTIIGLIVSILIIFTYVVPQVLAGRDPFIVSVIGSFAILFLTMYPAHGFTKQTTAALLATTFSLITIIFLTKFLVWFTFLTGFSTDDAFGITVQDGNLLQIKELVIGGIIIATAGALDDVTTGQAAAVFQLAKLQPHMSLYDLIKRGMLVGQEHVIALINTLVIAFVGAGFTYFVSLFLYYGYEGVWVIINREFIAEEIVKSLAISTGLVIAVPVSTIIAAYIAKKIFTHRTSSRE